METFDEKTYRDRVTAITARVEGGIYALGATLLDMLVEEAKKRFEANQEISKLRAELTGCEITPEDVYLVLTNTFLNTELSFKDGKQVYNPGNQLTMEFFRVKGPASGDVRPVKLTFFVPQQKTEESEEG